MLLHKQIGESVVIAVQRSTGLHLTPAATTTLHAHYAAKLILPIHGGILIEVLGYPPRLYSDPVLLPSFVMHRVSCEGDCFALFFEPEGALHWLSPSTQTISSPPLIVLPWREIPLLRGLTMDVFREASDPSSCEALLLEGRAALLRIHNKDTLCDPRIMALCERVESAPEEEYTLAMLAQSAALSPSRLLHLFREQMGIPLRPYLRWRRLWYSIALIVQGQRLIEAAHDAGFADQAHLSRTARHSLGRSLSEILTKK